ncbi:AAA family ATPase [Streptomyces sp. NPDC101213]|uniref:AAA family ATPase n=1 Tax=Streptomyces sp. NPDC101213 TaxID=3366130 RepID=UPI00380EE079
MTAPLTPPPPPHEPSPGGARPSPGAHPGAAAPHDAGHGNAGHGNAGHGAAGHGQDGPGMRTELREAAVITVVVALVGAALGPLWLWLAPHVPLVGEAVDGNWVVYLKDTEGEQAVGVDGTFVLLALACGAVSAAAVFAWRRRGGVPLVVALALGGLLGSLLAWRLGVWLGPGQDVIAHARAAGAGVTFSAPLKLSAKGALLAWPLAALLVHLGLTALFGPRDPEPYGPGPFPKDPYGAPLG